VIKKAVHIAEAKPLSAHVFLPEITIKDSKILNQRRVK
jgi:hypothetical protein